MSKPHVFRFVTRAVLVGAVLVVVGLALRELDERGVNGVGGITIADYVARAETQSRPAPDFTLPSLAGDGTITLSDYRASLVVLNFWATWCTPCRQEAPGLRRISRAYRKRGVQFLGVDETDDDDKGRAFLREFDLTYPNGSDPAGQLAFRYELFGMPTTFVIDRSGTIRYRFIGYLTVPTLREALDQVLSEGQP